MQSHQIEQLKEEIAAKDQALVKEHFEKARVDKEREVLGLDMSRAKEQLTEASRSVGMHEAEIAKLNHIVREADQVARSPCLEMITNMRLLIEPGMLAHLYRTVVLAPPGL